MASFLPSQAHLDFASKLREIADFIENNPELPTPMAASICTTDPVDARLLAAQDYPTELVTTNCFDGNLAHEIIVAFTPYVRLHYKALPETVEQVPTFEISYRMPSARSNVEVAK